MTADLQWQSFAIVLLKTVTPLTLVVHVHTTPAFVKTRVTRLLVVAFSPADAHHREARPCTLSTDE